VGSAVAVLVGLTTTAMRVALGTRSFRNRSRLATARNELAPARPIIARVGRRVTCVFSARSP